MPTPSVSGMEWGYIVFVCFSLPFTVVWPSQTTLPPPLSDYVHQIVLRPLFDPHTRQHHWQLDLTFTAPSPMRLVRHQTAQWPVTRLEDFSTVVRNVLQQWDSLCHMHHLCHDTVTDPGRSLSIELGEKTSGWVYFFLHVRNR